MTLEDLREALGRDLTRDDIRQLEVLAEFHGFNVREFLDGDSYRFDTRTGKRRRSPHAYKRTGMTAGMSQADKMRTLRSLAWSLGRCTQCRRERRRRDRKTCSRCARKRARWSRGKGRDARLLRQRRANAKRRRRLAAGNICRRCERVPTRPNRTTCETCSTAESIRHAARYAARKGHRP